MPVLIPSQPSNDIGKKLNRVDKKQRLPAPQIIQLLIELVGDNPTIWRRVIVPSDITLTKLHKRIQIAMGWFDCHLHEFVINNERYGQPEPDWDYDEVISEQRKRLLKTLEGSKSFTYIYDLGDDWEHSIKVESISANSPKITHPVCIDGEYACPPEDCGGTTGYRDLLEILSDPENPEHESMQTWVGLYFNPSEFDLFEAKTELAKLGRPYGT